MIYFQVTEKLYFQDEEKPEQDSVSPVGRKILEADPAHFFASPEEEQHHMMMMLRNAIAMVELEDQSALSKLEPIALNNQREFRNKQQQEKQEGEQEEQEEQEKTSVFSYRSHP